MTKLSKPTPGSDFDRSVMMRSWLSELPSAPVPDGFDVTVLQRARSGAATGSKIPWLIGSVMLLLVFGVVGFIVMQPSVVTVSRVPHSVLPLVDLYNVQPAPVTEDLRFEHLMKRKAPAKPYGVAGY